MDTDLLGVATLITIVFIVICIEIIVVWTVASYLATLLGANGFVWWCIAIVVFLLLNGVLGAIGRMGLE
jgi:hypothetical protein